MAQAEHIKDLHKNEGGLQFDRRHINVVRNAVKGVRSDLSTAIYGKFVSVIEHNDDTALIGGVQHLCVDLLYLCGIIITSRSNVMKGLLRSCNSVWRSMSVFSAFFQSLSGKPFVSLFEMTVY